MNIDKSDSDGFIEVTSRKINHKKPSSSLKNPVANTSMPSTRNSFEILNQPELNTYEIPDQSENIPKMTPHSNPLSSKIAQKSVQSTDLNFAVPSLSLKWNIQGMEVENVQPETITVAETTAERGEAHHMEEEPESFDIGDMDIMGLE